MEPFFDGGLFELVAVIGVAACLNYIFLKKYLLFLFSIISIACPVLLLFKHDNALYFWLVSLCIVNAICLVALLWKEKKQHPEQPIFNTSVMKEKTAIIRNRLHHFLKSRS